jgi:DNA-binding MarR family transcriptional regulator/N-acetylglutamate synthase-like GNAT family acetyltransferase
MDNRAAAIGKIRSFNRFYTRILGLLDRHVLSSDFSLTEARVLLELSRGESSGAREIGARLDVDPSYMSRILKRFETKKLIARTPSAQDSRASDIRLTDAGRASLVVLGGRSDQQVASLLAGLEPNEVDEVLAAMALIRQKLSHALFPATIRGYRKGDEEYIIRRHEVLYRTEYGLSETFAAYVDRLVRQFADGFDPEKECVLIAEIDGRPMGSVAVAKYDDRTAQFRFFLLEPEARGHGLGLRLAETALDFCREAGYERVFLTTVSLLTAARTIYARMGFRIVESRAQADWGRDVVEERWELKL